MEAMLNPAGVFSNGGKFDLEFSKWVGCSFSNHTDSVKAILGVFF